MMAMPLDMTGEGRARSFEHRPRLLAGATVLQIAPALRDDQEGRAVLAFALGLLRSGARALVGSGSGGLVGELQVLGGEWTELNVGERGMLRRRRTVQKLTDWIRSERVALVHAHGVDAARAALPALRQAGAAFVTSYRGMPPAPGWGRSREDAQARGHCVLACSGFAADLIAKRHRAPRERFAVIPRSVDTDTFDPAAVTPDRVSLVRQSWKVHPEASVVLAPGRLSPEQGQLVLVDAARALVNGGLRGVVFVIAGSSSPDPAYAAELDARIMAQGVGAIFRRAGHCPDMPAAYAASDVVVLPNLRPTTFSMAAAEAQAMGRPVVGSDLGAMPELILASQSDRGQKTGWLVRPSDEFGLARAIAEALTLAPEARRDLRQQARRFAKEQFSPEQVTAATLAMYEEALAPAA